MPSNKTMCGQEWIVEAHGCEPQALADLERLQELFRRLIADLGLHAVGPGAWHQFPNTGGITGLALLSESHLACHTFPEHGSLCLNLFCCRPRPAWDFAGRLEREFGAAAVHVRLVERRYGASEAASAA